MLIVFFVGSVTCNIFLGSLRRLSSFALTHEECINIITTRSDGTSEDILPWHEPMICLIWRARLGADKNINYTQLIDRNDGKKKKKFI